MEWIIIVVLAIAFIWLLVKNDKLTKKNKELEKKVDMLKERIPAEDKAQLETASNPIEPNDNQDNESVFDKTLENITDTFNGDDKNE